jgi:hypothetical protein
MRRTRLGGETVVGHGLHGQAEPGAGEEPAEGGEEDDHHQGRPQVDGLDPDRADADGCAGEDRPVVLGLGSPQEWHGAAQDDAERDRGHDQ